MSQAARTRIIIIVIGIIAVVSLGVVLAQRIRRAQVHTITGTIVRLDPQARVATIEIVRPKTGRTLQLRGRVPPECDIQIDGRRAELADLRVGEQARVEGRIHADATLSANSVRVTRAGGGAATAPATGPAADNP